MAAYAFDPVAQDLTLNPLSVKVKSDGVVPDGDGFYYKTGQLVEITGDEEVGIATNAGKACGILRSSRSTQNTPEGIAKDNVRVDVTFIGYRYLMRLTAEGALEAGDKVCQGTVSLQAVKKMSVLSAAVTSGAVDVVGDAAQPTVTLAGGILPEEEKGLVLKGAADGGEALVLVR